MAPASCPWARFAVSAALAAAAPAQPAQPAPAEVAQAQPAQAVVLRGSSKGRQASGSAGDSEQLKAMQFWSKGVFRDSYSDPQPRGGGGGGATTVFDIGALAELEGRPIAVGDHCYGCTAGSGSGCQGALA